MPTRLQLAKRDIESGLDSNPSNVFAHKDLSTLLGRNRASWRLAQNTTTREFIEYLTKSSQLRKVTFKSEKYRPITRYVWRTASELQLGLSLKTASYLCHATALYLHGITDQLSRTIYVNREQSPKPKRNGELSQDGITRAFAAKQRISEYAFQLGDFRYVLLSGKHTGQLGVIELEAPSREGVKVTDLERTLIDIVVRPAYAGGVFEVLDAFLAARDRVSVSKLIRTLRKLDYVYPYHQAIGFLMEKAGYAPDQFERLLRLGCNFDFYLAHGMHDVAYSERWRLFYPKGL